MLRPVTPSSHPLESNQNLPGFSRARRPTTQEWDVQLLGFRRSYESIGTRAGSRRARSQTSTRRFVSIGTRAGSRRARSQTRSDALCASGLEQARAERDHKRAPMPDHHRHLFSCHGDPLVHRAHLGRWRGPATARRTSGVGVPVVTRDTPVSIRDLQSDRDSKTIYDCRPPSTSERARCVRGSDGDVGLCSARNVEGPPGVPGWPSSAT
jgi:hypothetical protein